MHFSTVKSYRENELLLEDMEVKRRKTPRSFSLSDYKYRPKFAVLRI